MVVGDKARRPQRTRLVANSPARRSQSRRRSSGQPRAQRSFISLSRRKPTLPTGHSALGKSKSCAPAFGKAGRASKASRRPRERGGFTDSEGVNGFLQINGLAQQREKSRPPPIVRNVHVKGISWGGAGAAGAKGSAPKGLDKRQPAGASHTQALVLFNGAASAWRTAPQHPVSGRQIRGGLSLAKPSCKVGCGAWAVSSLTLTEHGFVSPPGAFLSLLAVCWAGAEAQRSGACGYASVVARAGARTDALSRAQRAAAQLRPAGPSGGGRGRHRAAPNSATLRRDLAL